MERLNVAPEALRKANPQLVYVRLAGSRHPLFRNFPSHDLNFLAAAGLLPALDSVWQRLQLADISAAFWMAMAALEGARRGGGSYEIYADKASHVFAYPKIPHLDGNAICYSIYPCSEGNIALAALEPHLWERFCRAMKRDEWANSAFTTVTDRNPIYRELCSAFSRSLPKFKLVQDWRRRSSSSLFGFLAIAYRPFD
jgi:alpha-methylacyl-CoA racemase